LPAEDVKDKALLLQADETEPEISALPQGKDKNLSRNGQDPSRMTAATQHPSSQVADKSESDHGGQLETNESSGSTGQPSSALPSSSSGSSISITVAKVATTKHLLQMSEDAATSVQTTGPSIVTPVVTELTSLAVPENVEIAPMSTTPVVVKMSVAASAPKLTCEFLPGPGETQIQAAKQ
jgi:hypothetical protein